jgi:hypothetical protein
MRQVRDGERLSGHGNAEKGYPEILILDGNGPGGGSLICSIESFHWADAVVKDGTTALWFEGKLCLAVSSGIVMYAE